MFSLRLLWYPRRPVPVAPTRPARASRPRLELLEDRLAPAVLEVVGTGGNNTSTFDTFAQAYAASTSPSDVIQIEPGANVGDIALVDPSKALTVQGDPNFGTENNQVTAGNVLIGVNGATIKHLDVGNITVSAGFGNALITDTHFGNFTETAGNGNGSNTLSYDDITGIVTLQGGATMATASTGDQIQNSDFMGGAQLLIGTPGAAVTNASVTDSDFEPGATTQVIITDSQNIVFRNTALTLTSANDAVVINNTLASLPVTGIQFIGADLRTEGGIGIHILATTPGSQVGVSAEGVAFQGNTTAIELTGTTDLASGSYIDAGGGSFSSGGNEFNVNVTTGVLVNDAGITSNNLTVFAANNALGPNVSAVVVSAGSVSVNQGTNLSAQQRIVQGMYHSFLNRAGSVSELNFWAGSVTTATTTSEVADSIIRSQEGANNLVNKLFNELLGRNADSLALSVFGGQIMGGATEETVIEEILSSQEFASRANGLFGSPGSSGDLNFIHALYHELLGRTESASEDSYWQAVLAAQGPTAVVAGFLSSTEFRNDFVQVLYSDYSGLPLDTIFGSTPDLLCRNGPAATSETSFWVNSSNDLLQIEEGIASSQEFANSR